MSRIDEAWARASGPAPYSRDSSARIERVEAQPDSALQHYPREAPAVVAVPTARQPPWTIVAPRSDERRTFGPLSAELERKLVIGAQAQPVAVEQYRRLAGVVHELQIEQGLKTLMVTSALPNEGKTLTVVNLALTLSEACERRVLLIDADVRRPSVHEILSLPNTRGLSDVLRSDRGEMPVQQLTDYLSVLPAGNLDQPMALTSARMRALLEQCAASYDWVLIDAAPVGFMPDAQVLARLTRAVLFVIAANATPHLLVSRAIAEIGAECVVGTVLNSVEDHNIPAAAYYRDYYSPLRPLAD